MTTIPMALVGYSLDGFKIRELESGRTKTYKVSFLTLKDNIAPLLRYACDMFYIHIILSLKIFICIVHLMLYKLIQIPNEMLNNNKDN